jgi:hypothetical protein
MIGQRMRGRLDQAQGAMKELEGRLRQLRAQLTVLQGRAQRARGTARLELVRLERQAARQVARADKAVQQFKKRVGKAVVAGRRQVDEVMRSVEPSLERSLHRAREIGSTAARLPRAVQAGLQAGRRALSRRR